jgi:hypothetical protein
VGPLHPDRLHERGHVVGEQLGGVGAVWFAGLAGAAQVDGDAGEVLGVVGHLEGVAGLVDGEVGDEYQRLPGTLLLVVDVDVVGAHRGHVTLLARLTSGSALISPTAATGWGSWPSARLAGEVYRGRTPA